MHGDGKTQCVTIRYYRMGYQFGDFYIYVQDMPSGTLEQIVRHYGGNFGTRWRTFKFDVKHQGEFRIVLRMYSSCNGWGNQAIDDVIFDERTCQTSVMVDSAMGRKLTFSFQISTQ